VGRASRAEGQRSVGPPYKSKTLGAENGRIPKKRGIAKYNYGKINFARKKHCKIKLFYFAMSKIDNDPFFGNAPQKMVGQRFAGLRLAKLYPPYRQFNLVFLYA